MTEANMTGYTVIYRRVSGSGKRQDGEIRSVFPATATSGVINGLVSEAIYMFQVLASAVTREGDLVGNRSLLTPDTLVVIRGIIIFCYYYYSNVFVLLAVGCTHSLSRLTRGTLMTQNSYFT